MGSSGLLLCAWPHPGGCRYLWSDLVDGRALSSVSQPLQTEMQINKIKQQRKENLLCESEQSVGLWSPAWHRL